MIKKWSKRNIPFTVVRSAAEVKRKLIKEFENTTNIHFPSTVRNILLTMNHKQLGKELANMSRSINLEEKQNDK
ncbi:hypothetical protein V425_05800 [Lactococcus lactis RTB018]|nr:hypothetical protein [Lactococcus lactis]OAZ16842.1 hypothetical protein V425_05800 [Lactococcus lactis RTB018]